jgi:hypothetical protein
MLTLVHDGTGTGGLALVHVRTGTGGHHDKRIYRLNGWLLSIFMHKIEWIGGRRSKRH